MNTSPIPVDAIREAAQRPEIVAAMRKFYEDADRSIAGHAPTCWNLGNCCRFAEFGHRLYVTALEVCYYLATGDRPDAPSSDICPHARDGKCHARDRRPLGCRVFYCDPQAQDWQSPLTEDRLRRLRKLHDELGVPYIYVEWISVLKALAQ